MAGFKDAAILSIPRFKALAQAIVDLCEGDEATAGEMLVVLTLVQVNVIDQMGGCAGAGDGASADWHAGWAAAAGVSGGPPHALSRDRLARPRVQ